jgi:hypothetical protein
MNDYNFICIYSTRLEYNSENLRCRYNWKLSTNGTNTRREMVRLTVWQLQMAVL